MEARWPIVGRQSEFAAILDGSGRGVGAVVVGEPGVGKSVLVDEAARTLASSGWDARLVLCGGRSDFPLRPGAEVANRSVRTGRQVLVVDDAHLLDTGSADVLWRLAHEPGTLVLATVRTGYRVSDRVARLWTSGRCRRLDLAPLDDDDVRELLERVLGGDVEDRLRVRLRTRSAGNALLLRELVRAGLGTGAIARSQNVWRLAGDLPLGDGAVDIIRAALSVLDTDEREAAQLLAVGQPLGLAVAESLIEPQLMEALEERRVAGLVETSNGPVLTLTHPLYGEVLRADIAPLRMRRLRRTLIAALSQASSSDPPDVLRSVVWRVEIGDHPEPAELLAAARLARSVSPATSERLTRLALSSGATVEVVELLAEILIIQGRITEAETLLDGLPLDTLSAEERQAVSCSQALSRTRTGELGGVIAMVTGVEVDPSVDSPQLQAIYGQALMLDGHVDEASTVVNALLDHDAVDPVTRTFAAVTVAAGAAFTGRIEHCERVFRESLPAAEAALATVPFGLGTLSVSTTIGLAQVGRLDDADAIGQHLYQRALASDDEWLRPRGASALGVTALMRGQIRSAIRHLRITVASLNELDGQYLRYNLSWLTRALALGGLADEARESLDAGADAPDYPLFRADWLIAEAAAQAAAGALEEAADTALAAARYAASLGLWATVGAAAFDAARYAVLPEALELTATAAERVDGPLPAHLADFARARLTNDPRALSTVSQHFANVGTLLYAAEAADAAARALQLAGDQRAAARAATRARALHARCAGAAFAWAGSTLDAALLTPREQHVATLAAAGKSDAAIATELDISVRTVQNHLARGYTKLGINNRRDLAPIVNTMT